jgi:hypothetical protein
MDLLSHTPLGFDEAVIKWSCKLLVHPLMTCLFQGAKTLHSEVKIEFKISQAWTEEGTEQYLNEV